VGAKNVHVKRVQGFSAGNDSVLYRYTWTD
jgi:hypothetical protein